MNPLRHLRAWYRQRAKPGFIPEGMTYPCHPMPAGGIFVHGIELLNDASTPVLFAMQALHAEAGLPQQEAAVAVAICHETGGVLVPMDSLERAIEVADRIVEYAKQASWPLACRAVSAPAGAAPGR